MDRNKLLENCETFEDLAKEIWIQNYEISQLDEEYGKYDNGSLLYGMYLKPIRTITNSPFDNFFNTMSTSYGKVLCDYDEHVLFDGSIQAYEILLLYFQGKYKFKFIPHKPKDFVEFIFDEERKEICNELVFYLQGIQKRTLRNKLYCRKENNDTCSVSDTKYYWHTNEKDENGIRKSCNIYVDIQKTELDKPIVSDDGGVGDNNHRILDEHLLKQGIENSIESELFKEDEEESVYMYIYNNLLPNNLKRKIDRLDKCGYFVKKIFDKNYMKSDLINYEEEKIKYGGSFVDFGYQFMYADRRTKFKLLKQMTKKRCGASRVVFDTIYDLNADVYRELIKCFNSTNEKEIYKFCNSKGFLIIIDAILDKYFKEQTKVREIYMFNERKRIEMIVECEEYIKTQQNKDGAISTERLNRIFNKIDKVFGLRTNEKYKKKEITTQLKLEIMESVGFIFIKINGKNGYQYDICVI